MNETYKYQLNLPKPAERWESEEDEVHDLAIWQKKDDDTDYAVMNIITGNPGDEAAEVREGFEEELARIRASGDVTRDGEFVLCGEKGRLVEATYLEEGMPWRIRIILVEHNKRIYLIRFDQHEFGTKKTDHAWDTVIGSFRFTD